MKQELLDKIAEEVKNYLNTKGLIFVEQIIDVAENFYKFYYVIDNNLVSISIISFWDDNINIFYQYEEFRNEGRRQVSPQIEKLTPSIQFHIFHIEEEFEKVKPELDRGLECFKKLLEVYHNEYGGEQ